MEPTIEIFRTPDERFEDLPDWPYEPRYTTLTDGLRVHHVEAGPADGPTVVLVHGEPTWGYLYRKMIPGLVEAGCRVVVPDLIGFGRSDKPTMRDDYTYGRHVRWLSETFDRLGLDDGVTMFCQDWGGLLGLVDLARRPDRYRGVVAAATGVPPGVDIPMPDDAPFVVWRAQSQSMDPFSAADCVGGPIAINTNGHALGPGERRAYDAPFPDEAACAGARQFPLLVPLAAHHPGAPVCREAWDHLASVEVPVVCVFGTADTITGGMQPLLAGGIPGAAEQPHVSVDGAGHFIQEHAPDTCVGAIIDLLARTG